MAVSVKPTRLRVAATTAGPYVTVAEVIDLSGPNPSRDEVDVTAISSTSGYRSFIHSGFIDAGEVSCSINFLPKNATHATTAPRSITSLMTLGTTVAWRIVIAGASSGQIIQFPGYVQSFEPSFSVGEQVRADVTIRVTGAVTWPTT